VTWSRTSTTTPWARGSSRPDGVSRRSRSRASPRSSTGVTRGGTIIDFVGASVNLRVSAEATIELAGTVERVRAANLVRIEKQAQAELRSRWEQFIGHELRPECSGSGDGPGVTLTNSEQPREGDRSRRLSKLWHTRRICHQRSGRSGPRGDEAALSELRKASPAGRRGRMDRRGDNDVAR
jgi:hypothetical protein